MVNFSTMKLNLYGGKKKEIRLANFSSHVLDEARAVYRRRRRFHMNVVLVENRERDCWKWTDGVR